MKSAARVVVWWAMCAVAAQAQYGDKVDSLPGWEERAIVVLTNACRMAPVAYRDAYVGNYPTILLPENYPPVDPVFWHPDLALVSHIHSLDMATDCGMQHNSCDGTLWDLRVESYYSAYGWIAENISTGQSRPQFAMRSWIYDRGAADKSTGDGHRKNIMNGIYVHIGTGFALDGRDEYWTEDFGGSPSADHTPPHAIPAACHLFQDSGQTLFMMNYVDQGGQAPQSVQVVVDWQRHALSLEMGESARGTYTVSLARAADCRQYHFEAVDADGTAWRYPSSGYLYTYLEGGCSSDYDNSGGVRGALWMPHSAPTVVAVQRLPHAVRVLLSPSPKGGNRTLRLFAVDGRLVAGRVVSSRAATVTIPVGAHHALLALEVQQDDGKLVRLLTDAAGKTFSAHH